MNETDLYWFFVEDLCRFGIAGAKFHSAMDYIA